VSAPAAPRGELARRLTWLMLLRTVVISLVLGLSLWLGVRAEVSVTAPSQLMLLGVVVVTYLGTIVYAVLLRGGVAADRLVWPQLAGDLAVTTALVYVTGGAQSAYTFFFALSVVGAGAVRFRQGAIVIAALSVAFMCAVSAAAWARALPLPMVPQVTPWMQSPADFAASVGLNLAALIGVGVLSSMFGGELQRTATSLAQQSRATADLIALNRDIVRSLSSGLITVDRDNRVLTINETALELLGEPGVGSVGRPVDDVMPGLGTRLDGLGEREALRRTDLALPDRTLGISVSPLRDDRDRVIGRVVNFVDLTELRKLEETMRRAERLATVGELAAGIAHEIRNPLAAISGSIELLSQAAPSTEDDRALMAIVMREIDRLNSLITELLEYANPRPRELHDVDLAELLDDTAAALRMDRSWGAVAITVDAVPRPLTIAGDAGKLRQVIWNLARNGVEAASGGGGHVWLRGTTDAEQVHVVVEDDGPGIAAEHVSRVFDPFFTTKARGTGLGLATSHAIVAEHGGAISVDSAPGAGTRFTIRVPRARRG